MQTIVFLFLISFGIWLLVLSLVLRQIFALFKKLTKGVDETDLKKILEKILSREDEAESRNVMLAKRISFLEEDGKLHIQKIGYNRFNPFKELGGDHSFSVAILDDMDSGIVITSLHTRDRTRVYVKEIKKGKSSSELSVDERKALQDAQKGK